MANQILKMKTSIKLLLAALLVLGIALFAYDKVVVAEYKTAAYKDAYRYYTDLKFKDFDTINVNSVSAANVKFEQGPFRVRLCPGGSDFTRLSQDGKTLSIDAVFKHAYQNSGYPYLVIISCPKIAELRTNARYGTNGGFYIDTVVRNEWNMRKVWIEGFKQDSMTIREDYASRVFLANNQVGNLNAAIGLSPASGSQLNILNGNRFDDLNLDIGNKSTLLINTVPKTKFKCQLADSARMVVTGASQNILKK